MKPAGATIVAKVAQQFPPFTAVTPALRGVFAGAGSDGLNEAAVCDAILRLTDLRSTKPCVTDAVPFAATATAAVVKLNASSAAASLGDDCPRVDVDEKLNSAAGPELPVIVAYLGTATYDLPNPRRRQTALLAAAGAVVAAIDCADPTMTPAHPSVEKYRRVLAEEADVIVISGGNTLYAMDRWKALGLDAAMKTAMERGCVMSGGSAGAICWFDAGHSDSMDPDTYRQAMLDAAAKSEQAAKAAKEAMEKAKGDGASSSSPNAVVEQADEASGAPKEGEAAKPWEYIRVSCLGLLPSLVCPHHDKVQSNGLLRAEDFDAMLLRHPGENGLCIDHWAALVVEGGSYSVLSVPGKEGSKLTDGSFVKDRSGVPAVWRKAVVDGEVALLDVPAKGRLQDIIARASQIVPDPREEPARALNPAAL